MSATELLGLLDHSRLYHLRVLHALPEYVGLQITDAFHSVCCWKVTAAEMETSNQTPEIRSEYF